MSIAPSAPRMKAAAPPAQVERPIHRFTVAQYHHMTELGVLTMNDKVELLDGYIVDKMPQNPPHPAAISRIMCLLARLLSDDWVLRVQAPITLRVSEPEPDVVVAVGPEENYSRRHPGPREVALVIEVADSSLMTDRRDKLPRYAAERVPECWLVNLVDGRLEVYTKPRAGKKPGYQTRRDYTPDQAVPLVLRSKAITTLAVRDLLPR